MGKTKNNHYLSQCISKNFIVIPHEPFWQYDCANQGELTSRNINKLFAERRLWGQDFEDTINKKWENDLSKEINNLISAKINRQHVIGKTGISEVEFNGLAISDIDSHSVLSKLVFQSILLQRRNATTPENDTDKKLARLFEVEGDILKAPLILGEINPLMPCPPLILIDNMLFIIMIPERIKPKKHLGHICFFFPISTKRFLFWGNDKDFDYFAWKYQNIDFLNLSRIEQNQKVCKIASQDKNYIQDIKNRINSFNSGEKQAIITASRNGI